MIMNAKKHQVFSIVTKEFVQCTSFSLSNVLRGSTQRATYQHCYPMSAYKKGSRVIVQRKQKIAFYKKTKINVILFCLEIKFKINYILHLRASQSIQLWCIKRHQGTGNGAWGKVLPIMSTRIMVLIYNLKFMQLILIFNYLLILSMNLLVDICRSGAVTQDYI